MSRLARLTDGQLRDLYAGWFATIDECGDYTDRYGSNRRVRLVLRRSLREIRRIERVARHRRSSL